MVEVKGNMRPIILHNNKQWDWCYPTGIRLRVTSGRIYMTYIYRYMGWHGFPSWFSVTTKSKFYNQIKVLAFQWNQWHCVSLAKLSNVNLNATFSSPVAYSVYTSAKSTGVFNWRPHMFPHLSNKCYSAYDLNNRGPLAHVYAEQSLRWFK